MNKKLKKLKSDEAILGETIFKIPDMLHTLDFLIMAEEHLWSLNGRNSIFIESTEIAKRLYEATYDAKWMKGIQLPFESFILSIPKDFEVEGIPIPGCLVTWVRFCDFKDLAIVPMCKKSNIDEPLEVTVPQNHKDSMTAHISYQDPFDKQKFTYARMVIPSELFGSVLASRNTQEFRIRAGDYSDADIKGLIPSDDNDLTIQFTLLKIILAMSVFNQATDSEHLTNGLPGGHIQVDGLMRELKPQHKTLSMPPIKRSEFTIEKEDHYRSFYFRQLRDERYYRGEYANWVPGSRWTFVNDAWVSSSGKEIDPYTQSGDDLSSMNKT